MSLIRLASPTHPPITLDRAKEFLRVLHDEEDALIYSFIISATEMFEERTNRRLMAQTWEQGFDDFDCMRLRYHSSLLDIDSVQYLDIDKQLQTIGEEFYYIDRSDEPYSVDMSLDFERPETARRLDAVRVVYTLGAREPAQVDDYTKNCLFALVGFLFENRQGQPLPEGFMHMFGPKRVFFSEV